MKKIIAVFLLLCGIATAQVTIVPTSPTNAGAIVRNKLFSELNGTYILRPAFPVSSLVVTIRNRNTTNAHTFSFFIWQTSDETISNTVLPGGSTGWTQPQGTSLVFETSSDGVVPCITQTIPSNQTNVACRVTIWGAKKVALIITGSASAAGSPDTVDIYYSWTPTYIVQFPWKSTNIIGGFDGSLYRQLSTDGFGKLGVVPMQTANVNLNAAPTVSAANTAATVTLASATNKVVCIRTIAIKATGAAATSTLVIQNGGATTLVDFGTLTIPLNGPATVFTGAPLYCSAAGDSVLVVVGAGGAGAVTTTSVVADRM